MARRLVTWSLAAFVLLRLIVIVAADLPTITPDEYGSWAIGRWLAGHQDPLLMQTMPRYSLVPGAVTAPFTRLPVGPGVAYQLTLVVLSGFTVAAAVLVRRTVARLTGDREVLPAAAFALVLLWPATFVTGSFSWAEPTVLLWWALLLWSTVALWTDRGSRIRTAALLVGSVAAGLAPFVHGRLLAVPVVWTAVLVARVLVRPATSDETPSSDDPPHDRRALLASCGLGLASMLAVGAVGFVLDRAAADALWTDATSNGMGQLADSLTRPSLWRSIAWATAGQLWYVLVSSFGLAGFGVAFLVRAVRHPWATGVRAAGVALAALLASNVALSAITSGVGIHDALVVDPAQSALRWDHFVYGRYNDAVTVVLAVLGLAWLWRATRRSVARVGAALAVAVVACVLVVAWAVTGADAHDFLLPTIAGVSLLASGEGSPLPLVPWTAAGLLAGAVIVVGARNGRRMLLGTVGVVVAAACSLAWVQAVKLQHAVTTPSETVAEIGAAPADGATLVIAADTVQLPYLYFNVYSLQHELLDLGWRTEFVDLDSEELVSDADDRVGDVPVLLALTDDHGPLGPGWDRVAEFEGATFWLSD